MQGRNRKLTIINLPLTSFSGLIDKESNSKPFNELFKETNDVRTGTNLTDTHGCLQSCCVIPDIKVFIMTTLDAEFDFITTQAIDNNCNVFLRTVLK